MQHKCGQYATPAVIHTEPPLPPPALDEASAARASSTPSSMISLPTLIRITLPPRDPSVLPLDVLPPRDPPS